MANETPDQDTGPQDGLMHSVGESTHAMLMRAVTAEHPADLAAWLTTTDLDGQTVAWLIQQGLGPVTYYRLHNIGLETRLAANTLATLRTAYLHTVINNALILNEASRWAACFDKADIPAVWIKGVPLSYTIYSHPGLRPMSDMDVVVQRNHRRRALALVEQQTGQRAGSLAEHSGMHACFDVGRHKRIKMEVHWSLLDIPGSGIAADLEWFLDQRQRIQVKSTTLLTLKPEAHLLYLCAHAEISHGEGQMRLLRYLDLHQLIKQVPLDWALIIERAVHFGWTYAVKRALEISQHYFSTPLPDYLLSELQLQRPAHEDIRIVTRRQTPGNRWEHTLRRFETMAWPIRLRLAFQLAFPPATYIRWRYRVDRSWKLPFFYIFRWYDVLGEALKTAGKQIRRKNYPSQMRDK